MLLHAIYPFTAVVGLEQVKRAILIALVNPHAGGLLIGGRKGTAKSTLVRAAQELLAPRKIIELPLNVTEDMLFGSIDIEYAVSKGERRFLPGILGKANDNVLYIDEANLLRQELLTAVLDANTAGFNHVERDGISFTHEVNYTVIGTMNPEEGILPGHILDRFGMYVDVQGEAEIANRVEIIKRTLAYGKDIADFRKQYAESVAELRELVNVSRETLKQVEVTEAMMQLAAQMCTQAFCAGHRAEIYLLEAARAIAALENRTYILPKDMQEAAVYVLAHRMRTPPETQEMEQEQQQNEEPEENQEQEQNQDEASEQSDELPPPPPLPDNEDDGSDENSDENNEQDEKQEQEQNSNQLAPEEQIADIDRTFRIPKLVLDMGKNTTLRRGSGKRSATKTDLKQGR
ncbi:MAG: AAA family ATPase, partial [Phascolarctobacterium sp.]|nr:AAA family ATPase [Phascolarctobacterium sp.]